MMKAGALNGVLKAADPEIDDLLSLDYLAHFVIRLYEDFSKSEDDPKRFRIEILMNQGMQKWPHGDLGSHVRGL